MIFQIDSLQRVVRPAFYFVTIDEVKRQCSIDESDASNDTLLNALIPVAQSYCESRAGRTLTPTKWLGRFDDWEYVQNRPMEIPNAPLLYHATDYPIVIVLDSGQYVDPLAIAADTLSMPGTVTVSEWPTGVTNTGRASITWWAGHQTLAEIPTEIRHAGVMLVAHYFENREATSELASIPVPYAVDALLASASYAGRY